MSSTMRGADIVARSLERLGCKRIFTLSGNHIMSLFDATLETKIKLVHVRHEAAAVHMADGWGRPYRRARCRHGHRRARTCECYRRPLCRTGLGVTDGAAVGTCCNGGVGTRRLPGAQT